MASRHYFRCAGCGKHLTYVTEHEMAVQPGRTHEEALDNGAQPAAARDPGPPGCMGLITYCSGFDIQSNRACVPAHRGTESIAVAQPPAADPNWNDFAGRVTAAWTAFVNSGYSPARRGANNFGEYHPPPSVLGVLQRSGGAVLINGATYIVSNSLTAGVSLHRTIPAAHQAGTIRSFIFHL